MEAAIAYDHPRWEEKQLAQALKGIGVRVHMVNTTRSPLQASMDCVVVRNIALHRAYYTALHVEYSGGRPINRPSTIRISGDKIETLLLLSSRGIPVPKTLIALTGEAAIQAGRVIGYPLVDKPPTGSWGRLVSLVKDPVHHRDIVEHRDMLQNPQLRVHLVQEYIDAGGADIRCLYAGGEIVACMTRKAHGGEWRSNVARGARVEPYHKAEAMELAYKAAEAVGGDVVSIDILPGSSGFVVNEVNGVPEFRGLASLVGNRVIESVAKAVMNACKS